ncbi:hypothetical protein GF339_14770 [candidate division KSB3 bacterium]|uniref:Uncharacterized protein n=1 Tax=candidate division KSB3 bacterium TaxID=2044937 RepID=A0A9D5Q7F9_9BACT|nr:hypothetical protein [candidate division KSB3 bacterium]MBD3325846.1 hypothetical protein [candidate division KSB3 bacterium]
MSTLTLSSVLDDLRTVEQGLRKFEQRYWLSSDIFYELYTQGMLDDGVNAEDFAEWAGHYRLKQKREATLLQFSRKRVEDLRQQAHDDLIHLLPQDPVLEGA